MGKEISYIYAIQMLHKDSLMRGNKIATSERIGKIVAELFKRVKRLHVESISRDDVINFLHYKKKSSWTIASAFLRNAGRIKQFFEFCIMEEYIAQNPFRNIRLPRVRYQQRPVALNELQLKTFLDYKYPKLRDSVIVHLLSLGLRVSEATSLKRRGVDLKEKIIQIDDGKGGINRNVPLDNKTFHLLRKHLIQTIDINTEWVFPSNGKGRSTIHVDRTAVNKMLKKNLKKIFPDTWQDISGKCFPHAFRHTFVTHYVKHGGSYFGLCKLSGWSMNSAMPKRYLHFDMNMIKDSFNTFIDKRNEEFAKDAKENVESIDF